MFSIEVKTNQNYQIRKQFVKIGKWTKIKTTKDKNEAEKEIAYIQSDVQDFAHLLRNFKIEYRLMNDDQQVWHKEEEYRGER